MRVVFDTNVLVSALLFKNSVPAQALKSAENNGFVLYSMPALEEISEVLSRPKLSRFIDKEDVSGLLARINRSWIEVKIIHHIKACRDPKDDKFLELAVNGEAAYIVSGDDDLLTLGSYHGVEILNPAAFLEIASGEQA